MSQSSTAYTSIGGKMKVKYSQEFNKDMYSIVRNFNKRLLRLEKRGFTQLPAPAKVSELKSRYQVPSDLTRELNRLKNFKRGDVLKKIENDGGAKSIAWEFTYLKSNQKNAKDFFEREYERVNKRVKRFPGEKEHLFTIQNKLKLLDMNIDYMNQKQFRSAVSAVNEFATFPTRLKTNYRAFMSEVDQVMKVLNYSDEERDKLFRKFSKLTPTQFFYLYDNNDLIGKIYSLADSPEYGGLKLNDTEDAAREDIDTFLEEVDDMIKDAHTNAD